MANPQLENGYIKISNELFEALVKACLLGAEYQIVCFIIRKTYGFNKKVDYISLTQFEVGTKLSRPTIVKTLKNLISKNIILKVKDSHFSINKDYEKWTSKSVFTSKGVFTKTSKSVLTSASKSVLTHKRHILNTKDNSTFSKEKDADNKTIKSNNKNTMKQIDINTGEEINNSPQRKKMTKEQVNLAIAVGVMWIEFALKNTDLEKEEVPYELVGKLAKPYILQGWKYDDFKELFTYWFNKNKKPEKINPNFCLNKTFIAEFKEYKRSADKPVSNYQIAEKFKL